MWYGNLGNPAEVGALFTTVLFNAIPDTNHNANPTNPNRYNKGNQLLKSIIVPKKQSLYGSAV